jgi:copper chaperone NosL
MSAIGTCRRSAAVSATRRSRAAAGLLLALALGCGGGPPGPAPLDPANEQCAWCRMAVSSPRFAAQLVAPAEEPRFFDDLGCLRDFLAEATGLRPGAIVYVADHRTGEWVAGAGAVYTRQPRLDTPMGSHLIAHADAASRAADPDAAGGEALTARDLFGPGGPPDGGRSASGRAAEPESSTPPGP